MNRLRLIIDAQYDFIEGGKLPVNGASERMQNLAKHIAKLDRTDDKNHIVFTADWHPYEHCSFDYNGGEWPAHCIQHTHGAAIVEELINSAYNIYNNMTDLVYKVEVLTKGDNVFNEEYSIMSNKKSFDRIKEIIKQENINNIDIYGIVGTICVKNTILGLIDAGYKDIINVHLDYIANFDEESDKNFKNWVIENELIYS